MKPFKKICQERCSPGRGCYAREYMLGRKQVTWASLEAGCLHKVNCLKVDEFAAASPATGEFPASPVQSSRR